MNKSTDTAPDARRRHLARALGGLTLCGLLVFAGIYVYGLFSPARTPSGAIVDFGGLQAGQAALHGWNGRPIWVVHRTPQTLASLDAVAPFVAPGAAPPPAVDAVSRALLPQYGIYLAEAAAPGIPVRFVTGRPRGLPADTPWDGGFLDPRSGEVYDQAGRVYLSTARAGSRNLVIPPHRYVARDTIELGRW